MHRTHDFDDRESGLGIERRVPQGLEAAARRVVADRLIIGEYHRDEPDVGGSLNVVLSTQGMQSGPGSPDLSGE